MSILLVTDFNDTEVRSKITKNDNYIVDAKVLVHYYNLLKKYSINRNDANLFAIDSLSQAVKNYLIVCICLDVCYNAKGGNLNKVIDGVEIDQWDLKIKGYKEYQQMLLSEIATEDIYETTPEPDESTSSSVFSWGRA